MRDSFIEENCLYFLNEEENSHHQHELFREYAQILEDRLEKFMVEYSLKPHQLAQALDFGRDLPQFHEMVLEIDQEDDFQKFKRWFHFGLTV
jgi:hypothetical protein